MQRSTSRGTRRRRSRRNSSSRVGGWQTSERTPGSAEHAEQASPSCAVSTSKLDPVAVDLQAVDAGGVSRVGRARRQLGGDRGPREVAQLGERTRLHGAPGADDRDVVAQRLDLGQDVARQQHGATLVLRTSRMHRWNSASISGSRPDVGSSSTSSSAREARAAIRATFWRLPLE